MTTALMAALLLCQEVSKDELQRKLKDTELVGDWVYDDLEAGFARARKEAKPLMVVIRCVPCVSFKLIDRQVARREDPGLAALMDRFVCVRIVQGWGLDLRRFVFDADINWMVFLMNADGTLYGRYGTKPNKKGDVQSMVSVAGLRKALEGALELHAKPPASLAAKTAPGSAWNTPEEMPALKDRPYIRPADGGKIACVHCHWIHEGEVWSRRAVGKPLPDREIWAWPLPDAVGLSLDPDERASVAAVAPGSPAEKAGFRAGDRLLSLEGQPLISIADVQWVLHQAPDAGVLAAEVDRAGERSRLALRLPLGWRREAVFSWRTIAWTVRIRMLGVGPLEPMSAADRETAGLKDGEMALRLKRLVNIRSKDRNPAGAWFRAGDAIVEVDGRRDFPREDDLHDYLLRKRPGEKVELVVLRDGVRENLTISLP